LVADARRHRREAPPVVNVSLIHDDDIAFHDAVSKAEHNKFLVDLKEKHKEFKFIFHKTASKPLKPGRRPTQLREANGTPVGCYSLWVTVAECIDSKKRRHTATITTYAVGYSPVGRVRDEVFKRGASLCAFHGKAPWRMSEV
jgi:hypothetical protein